MAGVRHRWPGWCRRPCQCLQRSEVLDGCSAADGTPATSVDTDGPLRRLPWTCSSCGPSGSGPLVPQATAASNQGQRGRCPAGMAIPAACAEQGRFYPRHLHYGRLGCRLSSGQRGRLRVRCPSGRVRWLQEPVVGLAAAGGMQPTPLDASEPGGQGGRGAGRGRRSSPVG
jgi:hypothetical protein